MEALWTRVIQVSEREREWEGDETKTEIHQHPLHWDISAPGSQAFTPRLVFTPSTPPRWFPSFSDELGLYHWLFWASSLQTADCGTPLCNPVATPPYIFLPIDSASLRNSGSYSRHLLFSKALLDALSCSKI